MKKEMYELTQLNIRGSKFTANFGDEQRYNMVHMRRESRYGQPVGNVRIGWVSMTADADETMKLAQTLEAVSKIAAVLDAKMANDITNGIEQSLGDAGFDVDAAMKW